MGETIKGNGGRGPREWAGTHAGCGLELVGGASSGGWGFGVCGACNGRGL